MKIKTSHFLILAALLFVCVFQLTGCQTPKQTIYPVNEKWQTISNRWSSVPLKKIKQTAERGDVTAQYYLGRAYLEGIGVSKNQDEGLKWIKRGVDLKYPNAEFYLGWMYEKGTSDVPQDYDEAAKFYRLAAEQGHPMAQNNLGTLFFRGLGVPQDFNEAFKCFSKSAEQGEPLALSSLIWMYEHDYGGHNYDSVNKLAQEAAEQGSAEAQYQYGYLLTLEFNSIDPLIRTNYNALGGEWIEKAAAQGLSKAQYQLGEMYDNGWLGDNQRSNCIEWFLKAAAQGNTEALAKVSELPEYYPNNKLLESVNAIETLRQGAKQGSLDAQFRLAKKYQTGDGVPKDAVEAFKWMQKAAQHDASTDGGTVACDAQYDLGVMYEKGEGTIQDMPKAYSLYLEAANTPTFASGEADFRVGQMYEKGEGVPQDDSQAAWGYYCAAHGGLNCQFHNEAAANLLRLYINERGLPQDENIKTNQASEYNIDHQLKDIGASIKTPQTQFYAGEIYYQGKLVSKNLVEAAAWLRLSINQNYDDARNMMNKIEPEMSSTQKEASKNRAVELANKIRLNP